MQIRKRIAQCAVVGGFLTVACVIADHPVGDPRPDCTKLSWARTGNDELDHASWAAVNAEARRRQAASQAESHKKHLAEMNIWKGHRISPMYQVTTDWYDTHVWICEQFGDPPVPKERAAAFNWIDPKEFKTVGWDGIIKQLTITKDGKGYEVSIAMQPNLMSAQGGIPHTNHEFLETWFINKNDGSLEYRGGQDTNTPQDLWSD